MQAFQTFQLQSAPAFCHRNAYSIILDSMRLLKILRKMEIKEYYIKINRNDIDVINGVNFF